jgi:hypothetical protein
MIIGFSALCALLLSAVVAQGASAADNGQTFFECSEAATTKEFSDAHCDKKVACPSATCSSRPR